MKERKNDSMQSVESVGVSSSNDRHAVKVVEENERHGLCSSQKKRNKRKEEKDRRTLIQSREELDESPP